MKILSSLKITKYFLHETCSELMIDCAEWSFIKYGSFRNGNATKEGWSPRNPIHTDDAYIRENRLSKFSYEKWGQLWDRGFLSRTREFEV